MEIDFTPEELASLSYVASYHGTNPVQLVKDAAMRAVDEDRLFLEAVERGIKQADRGELIDHDEVVARFERQYGG